MIGSEALRRGILGSLLAWGCIWVFWFVTTRTFHPTRTLAVIVTTSLVVAYAAAVYVNHLVLIPQYWGSARSGEYLVWLVVTMIVPTAVALAIIRVSYAKLWGPDVDPNGVYKHFGIDLFGMAVDLVVAALVVRVAGRFKGKGPDLGGLTP